APRPPAPPRPAAPPRPPRPGLPVDRPDRSPGWGSGGYPVPPLRPVPPLPQPNGVLWAILPLITFGFATPATFFYAAVKRNSWNYGAASAAYGFGLVTMLAALDSGNALLIVLGTILMLTLWPVGTAHAFAVRRRVYPRETPGSHHNKSAVEYAKYRRNLRADARAIAADDPALAHELRIGRPDVPRAYDDGGLVDVNHAPLEIVAALPGMTDALAERVVRHRDEHGTFVSVEEMAMDCDLPPAVMPQLAEYTIFLP
ncbi:ComEA family DNA-binding protein, partial [Actinomadura opuntiae]|uniref:ComEA family DNA-binding protein n=1 Tax=Actinomadura sp. OS1-43 TaxID=604315 RepID=UPI00255A9857